MADKTLAEIETALRAKYPTLSIGIDGEEVELSGADYDARIAEMAGNELAAQDAATVEDGRKTLRQQAAQGIALCDGVIAAMDATPGTTAQNLAALRDAVKTLAQVERRVIVVLAQSGIVETDD